MDAVKSPLRHTPQEAGELFERLSHQANQLVHPVCNQGMRAIALLNLKRDIELAHPDQLDDVLDFLLDLKIISLVDPLRN